MPDLKVLRFNNGMIVGRPDIDLPISGGGDGVPARGSFLSGPTFYSQTAVAVQDAVRCLLTKCGTNYLAPNFGTNIPDIIMSRTADKNTGIISSQSQYSLNYMSQFRSDGEPNESIVQINNLTAKREGETMKMTLTLTTGAGEQAIVEVR